MSTLKEITAKQIKQLAEAEARAERLVNVDIDQAAQAAHDAYFDHDYDDISEIERELWRNVVRAVLDLLGEQQKRD